MAEEGLRSYRSLLDELSPLCLFWMKNKKGDRITFVVEDKNVATVQKLLETEYPGAKQVKGSVTTKGVKNVGFLGIVPKEYWFHKTKPRKLPCVIRIRVVICSTHPLPRKLRPAAAGTGTAGMDEEEVEAAGMDEEEVEAAGMDEEEEEAAGMDEEEEEAAGMSEENPIPKRVRRFFGRKTHITKEKSKHCSFGYTERQHEKGVYSFCFDISGCIHTCPPENIVKVPLTKTDYRIVLSWLAVKTPEEVFDELVKPLVHEKDDHDLICGIAKLRVPELKRIAKRHRLLEIPRRGLEDLQSIENMLRRLQYNGATVALKPPGVDPNHCELLVPEAAKYLHKDDLFIFLMTSFQAKMVNRFGKIISTDGTHCTLAYSKVKLLVVLVASYGDDNIAEKGKFLIVYR